MKAIKNFNAFKKSLLSATNGNMVESFDSSNQFGGCEYQSYRVYVDDVHYYNMFVIYNFATNTYDVSLETSICAVSTMTRVCKTQKAMIDSVVRWCYYSYLNTTEISAEYTDRCTESEKTETNKIKGHIYIDTDSVKVAPLPEQQTSEESIKDTIMTDDCIKTVLNMEELFSQMYGNTIRSKCKMYNNSCYGCPADRQGNRCGGKQWCKQTWKRYGAIVNPEWHHVSLATLAGIDNDMLDEKRQIYFKLNKDFKKMCNDLRKCKNGRSFDARLCNFRAKLANLNIYEKISLDMSKYLDRQISMMNVECGMWASRVEIATGYHNSRKYNKHAVNTK